jgi:hypothetical protein
MNAVQPPPIRKVLRPVMVILFLNTLVYGGERKGYMQLIYAAGHSAFWARLVAEPA